MLQYIASNMVTKAELPGIIREVVQPMFDEVKDYVDKKDREYKGELNLSLQKEDKKVDAVIVTLEEVGVVTSTESKKLQQLTPFPSTQ